MARDRRRNDDRDQGSDLRAQIFEMLLDRVRGETYPSTTVLDMLEGMARGDDETAEYTEMLMEKVSQDTYPSMDHLRRLQSIAAG